MKKPTDLKNPFFEIGKVIPYTHKTIFVLILILTIGCSSPQESLKKKKYDQSFKTSLKQLEKGKSIEKNKNILSQSLDGILAEKKIEKENLLNTNHIENFEKIIVINHELQQKINKGIPFLENHFDNQLSNLRTESTELSERIANIYFDSGKTNLENALANNDKYLSRNAYFYFSKAQNYGFGKESVDTMLQKSLNHSMLNYQVAMTPPFGITSFKVPSIFDELDFMQIPFTNTFYNRTLSPNKVDCNFHLDLSLIDFYYTTNTNNFEFQNEVIVGSEIVIDDDGNEMTVNTTAIVTGIVTEISNTKSAQWTIGIDVLPMSNNCRLPSTSFIEELNFVIISYELSGDERAIPDQYKVQNPVVQLSDDEMVDAMIDVIYEKIIGYIYQ